VDLLGTVLITAALVDVVLPLVEGRQHGWPLWTWLCLGAAPVALAAFAASQRRLAARGGAPLLDPAMFRARGFAAGLLTNAMFWCGQASFFLVFALYLQQGRGLGALDAGLVFTILAVAYLMTSFVAPGLVARHGRRVPATGALVLAAGHAALALAVADVGSGGSIAALVPGMVLVGAGMGTVLTPLNSVVLASLDPQRAGAASGALSTVQQVGNAVGVAVAGVIFFGAVSGGFGHAFGRSELLLVGSSLAVAGLARLLPGGSAAPAVPVAEAQPAA
jgi:Na+/melibiose symporter-like transporter